MKKYLKLLATPILHLQCINHVSNLLASSASAAGQTASNRLHTRTDLLVASIVSHQDPNRLQAENHCECHVLAGILVGVVSLDGESFWAFGVIKMQVQMDTEGNALFMISLGL